jgi:DNA-binding GntR family transcriptional regulator
MDDMTRKVPTHEVTYGRLRDLVLFGHLEPGQPVTIQGLIDHLGAGMTPVREAIRRLTAEGALTLQGNRRVVVPRLTVDALDQMAFVRLAVEPHLARLATAGLTANLIARLEAIDRGIDLAMSEGDVPGYLEGNHQFHFTLYDASNAPVLEDIARSLWLRFGPSLRVVAAHYGTQNLPDQHGQALAAMRAGDPDAVAHAVHDDIAQGVEQVRAALVAGEI